MDILTQFMPLIITTLSKEGNMVFAIGFILGVIVGGLVGVFVTPMFWKPK